jgi:hypothetical protein
MASLHGSLLPELREGVGRTTPTADDIQTVIQRSFIRRQASAS